LTLEYSAVQTCAGCGTQLAPTMKACPGCARLVHTEELEALAQTARQASERGDISAALAAWREALDLLPPGSRQHQIISAKITELGRNVPSGAIPSKEPAQHKSSGSKVAAGAGALGMMLWKLKTLLLGLSKAGTLFSMLLSLGVYWAIWGWKFALGIILSIYIHEMGHVFALRRYGFKASAPMFIPGLGAVVRLQQQIVNPREDAEIGLAGPTYGLGAALVALGIWLVNRLPIFAAIAGVGAWINLFNLLPVGPLDGGRGFHAMSRAQKFIAAAVCGAAWFCTEPRDGLLMLIGIVGLVRAVGDKSEEEGNRKACITYVLLVIALTAVSVVRMQAVVR
jgi:Zn-dependent protease